MSGKQTSRVWSWQGPPGDKATTGRRLELIEQLLRLSADPLSLAGAHEGVRGTGQSPPVRAHERRCELTASNSHGRRCTCWLRSLDQLDQLLHEMKTTERALWYAVVHRYRMCTRKPTLVTVKAGRPMLELNQKAVSDLDMIVWRGDGTPRRAWRPGLNQQGTGQTTMIVETWRHGLNSEFTDRGVRWLSEHFVGQPELPLDLLHAA